MATKTTERVVIPAIELKTITIRLVGDEPLICHAWSKKAKQMMLDKQMGNATAGKDKKDPWRDFCESLYWVDGLPDNPTETDIATGRFGFPTTAFKAAAIDAGFQQGVIEKKTTARGAFHIQGEFAIIEGTPIMREDMVRLGGISSPADIRYRAEFTNWATTLTITYNPKAITAEQIANLMNFGGFAVGVGEWRPAKDGNFGRFHVE